MESRVPSHWSANAGDPRPECEFRRFVVTVFGRVESHRRLGACDPVGLRVLTIQRMLQTMRPNTDFFHLCTSHFDMAIEPVAQRRGGYSVVLT